MKGISFLEEEFRKYLELERKCSPRTVVAYLGDLKGFRQYIQDLYEFDPMAASELDTVSHRMVRGWMGEMLDDGLARRSVARKVASLNAWFGWLRKTGRVDVNPASKVSVPKYDKPLPSFLKADAVERLFEEVEYPDNFDGHRDRAVMELLYSCGLRRAELISLEVSNVSYSNRTLKVMGKGRKERIIPFGSAAENAMRRYEKARREAELSREGTFFVRKNGEPMYPKLVYRIVEKYLQQASTLSKTSPHVLRHTFATHLLDRGADLNAIKELLGHSSLAATQVYLHNSIQKLKTVYDQAHPKAEA